MKITNKDILKEMFVLQQKLNDDTNGEGWENGYNKHGRIINWKRCIYMECAELIDSFSWKHWKNINADPNWENIKVEIVDIWHFVMSLALESYKNNKTGTIDDLVNYVMDDKSFKLFCKEPYNTENAETMEIINQIEHIVHATTAVGSDIFEKIIDDYFIVALNCGMNLESLYRYYLAKNILNGFRQDNGYKEGSYIKNWNGKEDNEVMLEFMEKERFVTAEGLYGFLDKNYKNVQK